MMKHLLILTLLFATLLAAAQTHMENTTADAPKGPIIDNINGNSGMSLEVLKDGIFDAEHQMGDGAAGPQSEAASHRGPQSTNNNTITLEGTLTEGDPLQELKANLRFYPNPAINNLTVELGDEYEATISLMNVLGQQVFHKQGKMDKATITVSDFPVGTYFLTIMVEGNRIVKRIEISR